MSEFQKWIASISGAVVGQIAVLAFFYLLITNSTSQSLAAKSASPQPREVTVMLSQLVEQAMKEELPPEPPEQPEEEEDVSEVLKARPEPPAAKKED